MTAPTTDAAAEHAAWFLARWAAYADGSSDEPPGDLAPEHLCVLLAERRQLRADLAKARADCDSWQRIATDREPGGRAVTGDPPGELRAASANMMADRLRDGLEARLSTTRRGRLALRLSRLYARRLSRRRTMAP